MIFRGRDRISVKRKAVAWWADHGQDLGLSLREFLSCCRMDGSEQVIVFMPPASRGRPLAAR